MSKIKFQGNASGTGVLTITSPNTNADRTITLPDEDVTLGAGTPSIDDNGNATAITIDSNENLLIGKTTYVGGSGVTGIDIRPAGMVNIAREGDTLMYMNRKTSDGDIVEFRKDGTTKGSIGVTSSGAYITLGGTGSANTLDDYEKGESTIAIACSTSGSITLKSTHNKCVYTKVGRVVHFNIHIRVDSISSPVGSASITGLPFTCGSGEKFRSAVTVAPVYNFASPSGSMALGYIVNNGTTMYVPFYNGSTQTLPSAGYFQVNTEAYITGSYMTD